MKEYKEKETVQDILDTLEEGVSYDIDIVKGSQLHWRLIGNSEIWSHCIYKGSGTQDEFDELCNMVVFHSMTRRCHRDDMLQEDIVELEIYI